MAKDKKSVLIYVDWINIFEELSDEEAGKLVKHLFKYVNDMNPQAPDRLTKLLFEPIKQTLKRDLVKYEDKREKNRENILKRWNKKDTTEYDRIRTDTKHTDIDSVRDIDSVSDSVIEKERYIIPPSVFLIKKYCEERHNGIDAEYFYDWYQTRGWKVGKDKMKDWQSAVRTWEQRNKKEAKPMMP